MSSVWITDNHELIALDAESNSRYKHDFATANELDEVKKDIEIIANKTIGTQHEDNPNMLVFPQALGYHGDDIDESVVVGLSDNKISTNNIMGFIGVNNTQINIKSRFANSDDKDYFLHYMLQKVFSINLFDIKHTTNQEQIFDFLLYLFPHFFKKALAQGVFKKYKRYEYNDANVRGPIDVNRHIRQNIPFRGTVAYSTREHSYDNEITQLIRHTIEYIKTKEHGRIIIGNDPTTKDYVSQIVMATPTYNVRERQRVINQNLRPIRHPYFSAYTDLQKICLRILRHESLKYGQEKDKVYGILFDGAWLWEEYLYTILKECGFKHPENKKHKGGFPMFEKQSDDDAISKNSRRLYPDFWKDNFILDAKYKHLNYGVGREDLYQVVTYMYCRKATNGAYVYPFEQELDTTSYELNKTFGYGGYIHVIPFYVPQQCKSWEEFLKKIINCEKNLVEKV